MFRRTARLTTVLLLVLSTSLTGSIAQGETTPAPGTRQPTALAIGRSVLAAGGDESSAGTLRLRGTIGQAIARLDPGQAGARSLQSGYWQAAARADALFADHFE